VALGAALVDRARVRRKVPARKVAGRTVMAPTVHAWFRCRLELRSQPQTREPSSRQPRVTKSPRLMFGVRDLDGGTIDVVSTDVLEVDSPELGRAFYEVEGDPDPMRKKRRVIGWEVNLKRIEDHEFDADGAGGAGA
jgi:hypothetical protein